MKGTALAGLIRGQSTVVMVRNMKKKVSKALPGVKKKRAIKSVKSRKAPK